MAVPESERRFVLWLALFAAVVAVLPNILAVTVFQPPGARYIGSEWATDDYMVYAAWTRQAMEGSLFFDSRFTTDPQAGLTLNLFFLLLGQLARVTGVAFALAAAKFVFSGAFVLMLHRLVRRVSDDPFAVKLACVFAVFGGGVGFLLWHRFGETIARPAPAALSSVLGGRLPTDVWQPEGFVFPSMITTGLFMAALCLMLIAFAAFLDARDSWKPVPYGFLTMLVLTNIHSYDVALVALVMLGFAASAAWRRRLSGPWLARGLVIAAGAIPAAAWLAYVIGQDAVFRARAAVPTLAPGFSQVVFGYLALLGLGLFGIYRLSGRVSGALVLAFLATLSLLSFAGGEPYKLSWPAWTVALILATVAAVRAAGDNPALNLFVAWGLIGLVAPYMPTEFQRKLAMGLAIPWGVLAALGVSRLAQGMQRGQRNLVTVLVILVVCGSSVLWLQRDLGYIRENVSRTTVHPVYLAGDARQIVEYLERLPSRKVVLAMPGIPSLDFDEQGRAIPETQRTPLVPDMNTLVSGLAGAYTYAGHWGETPAYAARRQDLQRFFLESTSDAERWDLIRKANANFVIAPARDSLPGMPLADLRAFGRPVISGPRFQLIRVELPPDLSASGDQRR